MRTLHLQDLSHLYHKPVNIIFNRLSNNKVQRGRKHSLIIQIVKTPFKRNEQRFKTDKVKATGLNKALSSKRISVEHVFARLKSYRLLSMPYYYARTKLDVFVKAIVNIYNLVKVST